MVRWFPLTAAAVFAVPYAACQRPPVAVAAAAAEAQGQAAAQGQGAAQSQTAAPAAPTPRTGEAAAKPPLAQPPLAAAPTSGQQPPAQAAPAAPPAPAGPAAGSARHLDWQAGPATGAIAPYLVAEAARAKAEGRRLLLYVGASWCEPCRRFHEAATAGALDDAFANLRIIEFDLDRDRERLAADGYASQLIPLIAVPGPDGRGNGKGMQGSIKGEGAVANMRPRLQELLAQP